MRGGRDERRLRIVRLISVLTQAADDFCADIKLSTPMNFRPTLFNLELDLVFARSHLYLG